MNEKKELITSYNELEIGEKRKELGREIAEITLIIQRLISDFNKNYQLKSMEDFVNLFEETTNEGEYLTGLYQDVIELKDIIGEYLSLITNIYYNVE